MNSKLFKETYDEALDKNSYEIRFDELISASLVHQPTDLLSQFPCSFIIPIISLICFIYYTISIIFLKSIVFIYLMKFLLIPIIQFFHKKT